MQRIAGEILFSPHDLINFMQCEFITWMDRRKLDNELLQPDLSDASVEILQKRGLEHERAFLEREMAAGKRVIDIAGSGTTADERIAKTIEAMHTGYDIIYQAQLRNAEFGGIADFLYKVDGASALGDYHYDVRDTKLAKQSKPEFLIQLCCYAEMIEALQKRLPERVAIVLGSGETEWFRTEDYYFYYRSLKRAFLEFVDQYDPNQCPDDVRELPFSRWNSHAKRIVEETDSLVQVANIRQLQIRRLKDANIKTMTSLANSELEWVAKVGLETFSTLKQQAKLQIASKVQPKPVFEVLQPAIAGERKGLALLPPPDAFDVWFDMEGYPHVEGGLEYLFGATHNENGAVEFTDFWAHDRESEKIAFERFIDWVFARWKAHPGMHVYHYANYEVAAVRRLMGRFGRREFEVDELLRHDVFVDLYQIIRHALRVGEPSYSIKYIEHLYRGKREGGVATATDSIVFYERWLAEQDGADWQSSKILADIREYNRADCESTMELTDWLRARQAESGIGYIPKHGEDADDKPARARRPIIERTAKLAEQMLADENCSELKRLLAQLLQFHEREAKPFWWSIFDRLEMTQEELILDTDCLGGLARTSKPYNEYKSRATWREYEYQFDSTQDTKLSVGAMCCLSYEIGIKTEITQLDREKGLVTIKLRAEQPEPQTPFGLIPMENYNTEPLQTAICDIVEHWNNTGELPPAISDFLNKAKPNLRNEHDPLVDPNNDLVDELLALLLDMQGTTLCIQGPPGSGKTTTASRVIKDLLARGHRIGITSNSHKSIENLLNNCARYAESQGVRVCGAKIGADNDGRDGLNLGPGIEFFSDKKKVFPPEEFNLIGGTTYAFCFDRAVNAFDYLFVDEAGQMSIANLLAMARCTKNIVLIGDQMQLEQPIQGFHPGASGMSTLEYYMGEYATIPPDRGVFLGTTYRMHPDVCSLISNAVYEGKLHAAPDTEQRVLSVPSTGIRYVTKQAGILYVPVEHDGNSQDSEEEAQVIRDIVNELSQCRLHDGKRIELSDILIVAPYNAQVRRVKALLPDGARVGSVDKFQGQEAPVVILSMCSSDANGSPRGLPFIFSRSRLNVAISRAQTLAIVVASPRLSRTNCTQVEHIALTNFFCRISECSAAPRIGVADGVH